MSKTQWAYTHKVSRLLIMLWQIVLQQSIFMLLFPGPFFPRLYIGIVPSHLCGTFCFPFKPRRLPSLSPINISLCKPFFVELLPRSFPVHQRSTVQYIQISFILVPPLTWSIWLPGKYSDVYQTLFLSCSSTALCWRDSNGCFKDH